MFLHSGRYRGVPVYSGLQYPKSRFTSPGFCPGHEVLELVRPVVPSTLALFSKRSRLVVSPAVRSTVVIFADRWPHPSSYCRVALRPSKAPLSSNLK